MFLWYILLLVSGPCLVVVFSSPRWPSAIALILKQQKILLLQQIRQCFQGKNVFGLKTCLDYCEDPARSCKIWIFPFLPKQNRFIKKEARVASLNLFERLLDLSQQHVFGEKLKTFTSSDLKNKVRTFWKAHKNLRNLPHWYGTTPSLQNLARPA